MVAQRKRTGEPNSGPGRAGKTRIPQDASPDEIAAFTANSGKTIALPGPADSPGSPGSPGNGQSRNRMHWMEYVKPVLDAGEFTADGQTYAIQFPSPKLPGCVAIGGQAYLFTKIIRSLTLGITFAEAVEYGPDGIVTYPDGRARRVVIKIGTSQKSPSAIIWAGTIDVLGTYLAYEITPTRRLRLPEWSRYVIIRVTNEAGQSRVAHIASMDFRQMQSRAGWIDQLDVSASGRVNEIKNYIQAQRGSLGSDNGLSIMGQGPLWLNDGTPNNGLDHRLVFVTQSVVFDETGEIRADIRPDLSGIPDSCGYFDITPPAEITEDEIGHGCREFLAAYDECPASPEIPAAFIGQLFTGFLAAVRPEYFSAIFQSGEKGSGKTRYSARWDSVQSRTLRGELAAIRPALNLGDNRGTVKGPGYRVAGLAGFTFTIDDVIKSGDSPARIAMQSQIVSDLLRSFDNGGAALARVDRARNMVGASESPALHTSVKFTSEIPVNGGSTLDRMIVLPHLSMAWGKGSIFDTELSLRLSEPASRERQHRAWSAFAYWAFTRLNTDMAECLDKAYAETTGWDVPSRTAERYAPLVAGNLAFARFCTDHGIDAGDPVCRAIAALRDCAKRQAQSSIPLALRFFDAVRRLTVAGRAYFPGPPVYDPDGSQSASYSVPWAAGEVTGDDGITEHPRVMPPNTDLGKLGLMIAGQKIRPLNGNAALLGFVIPPRMGKGGPKGNDLTRNWLVACKPDQFAELCRAASHDGFTFRPADVLSSLQQMKTGDRSKPYIGGKQERAYVIDCAELFADREI